MPVPLHELVALLDTWYNPRWAESWDAVGLVCGDPEQPVGKVLLAVDPAPEVVAEAAEWGADLLLVHHPLLLTGVHSVATTTPKGRVLHRLVRQGTALFTAHTNADVPEHGVNEALARAVGIVDPAVVELADDAGPAASRGHGRIGRLAEPTTLRGFAERVARALPATAHGVRVAGDPDRPVRTVVVGSGSGDFLLDTVLGLDADVYLTSDLRHHRAGEFLEHGRAALVDVAHWAAEWTWLPVVESRIVEALAGSGTSLETRVSTLVTDPWSFRVT
ncbi:Nif3-like dinuclear metal center hexameric protein [Nocardioides mesophilus]|uniref:GTP cyclohydrolase 1 type 2 homolog n=1 Tax=Nocardioides mesophilus TaxID=433659 RepID=A0A7G9RCE6_9ACTN|nr:Nif3-like dinuclear metal center hexameric protein [Nocardioides mesophilus]QNN53271.1 Nif3-like dinuclear metal center hexameric protein [Nocardioides mesophilus]